MAQHGIFGWEILSAPHCFLAPNDVLNCWKIGFVVSQALLFLNIMELITPDFAKMRLICPGLCGRLQFLRKMADFGTKMMLFCARKMKCAWSPIQTKVNPKKVRLLSYLTSSWVHTLTSSDVSPPCTSSSVPISSSRVCDGKMRSTGMHGTPSWTVAR